MEFSPNITVVLIVHVYTDNALHSYDDKNENIKLYVQTKFLQIGYQRHMAQYFDVYVLKCSTIGIELLIIRQNLLYSYLD